MSLKIKNKQIQIVTDFDINNNRLINVDVPISDLDAVNKQYLDTTAINYALGTGLYSGGTISIDNGTQFSISSGVGYFVEPTTKEITKIEWGDINNIDVMVFGATDITISVAIDENGDIFQQIPRFSYEQRNNLIILGELFIEPIARILVDAARYPVFSRDLPSVIDFSVIDGATVIEGNNIQPNGANLSLDAIAGKMTGYSINAPNNRNLPNVSEQPFISGFTFYTARDNGTEWIYDNGGNTIDPTLWSNGSPTLQPSTPSKYSLRVIFRSATDGDVFFISYVTQSEQYDNIQEAESNLNALGLDFPNELYGITSPLAWLIVRGNATDLSDIIDAKIIPIQSISNAAGSVATDAVNVSFNPSASVNLDSTNAQDAIETTNNKIESLDYAETNIGMIANSGTSGIYLATDIAVLEENTTNIKVDVNGLGVTVGNGTTIAYCFFSEDGGISAKTLDNITQGDFLYWNGDVAGYQLDENDLIDFIYMVL